ncbi:hypothetical protein NQ318_019024 [Aromia moschata]|uniref:Uncharacterized protein n=1 Tax=Aromia moschata TaxID=1265417 RepID=A0AAV8Y0Q6_9CUCU|nr:hypothetical protein NQ318_019024 [Aromia moschata]
MKQRLQQLRLNSESVAFAGAVLRKPRKTQNITKSRACAVGLASMHPHLYTSVLVVAYQALAEKARQLKIATPAVTRTTRTEVSRLERRCFNPLGYRGPNYDSTIVFYIYFRDNNDSMYTV